MYEIFLDSCTFDPMYAPEDRAALDIFDLEKKGLVSICIAHSTEKEIDHPNTPSWVKEKASQMIFTVQVGLTDEKKLKLDQIESILAGKGQRESIKSDAKHIFEAQKYRADFITTDNRILKKFPVDRAFSVLAHPIRRGIVARLANGPPLSRSLRSRIAFPRRLFQNICTFWKKRGSCGATRTGVSITADLCRTA